jgi:hypothetical protein
LPKPLSLGAPRSHQCPETADFGQSVASFCGEQNQLIGRGAAARFWAASNGSKSVLRNASLKEQPFSPQSTLLARAATGPFGMKL